jgi:tetratricopeptide (TPR) repeat protein
MIESAARNRKVRGWMLVYTVLIGLVGILAIIYGRHSEHQYPIAYEMFSALSVILIFAGNFLYAFACVTPLLRKIWKFAFPLVIASFVTSGVLSFFQKEDHPVGLMARVLTWLIMVALFFPSFRANFLLGYGNVDRVRTIAPRTVMNEDPLQDLIAEIRRIRRTTQTAWVVAILLLTTLVVVTVFQVHFERKNDSWVTVRRLADAAKYEEALTIARHLAEKDPDSPQTRILMGNLQLALGQLHQAEASYARAYELLPNEATMSLLNAVRARIEDVGPTPTSTP